MVVVVDPCKPPRGGVGVDGGAGEEEARGHHFFWEWVRTAGHMVLMVLVVCVHLPGDTISC